VDKVQDRRISRLENAVEKKFAIKAPFEFRALTEVSSMKSQIIPLLPPSNQDATVEGRIGNQISLRNFRCDYTLHVDAPMAVRVIFFWLTVPRTWSTTSTGAAPSSTAVDPTWPQLLSDFALAPDPTGTPPVFFMNNVVAQHQMLTDSNHSPIVRLSDRVHYLGSPQGGSTSTTTTGLGSENCIRKLVFSKSYKDMKLTYNDVTSAAGPVNRQLYMAVCQGNVNPLSAPGEQNASCAVTGSCSMRYTDS
jgi:hypothetical protein